MTYSRSQILLHWATFGLVVVLALSGLAYTYEWAGKDIIRLHQFAGQALILLIIGRLISRAFSRPKASTDQGPAWERRLATTVHVALYVCLIAYLVTGYVSGSALRDPVLIAPVDLAFARSQTGELLLEIHFALKWVLLGLLGLHILGALKHALWDQPSAPSNMLSLSKPTGS